MRSKLCTASNSSLAFDLRCAVREGVIAYMQREYPQFLPRLRVEDGDAASTQKAGPPDGAPQPA